jgi:hypothetical protein
LVDESYEAVFDLDVDFSAWFDRVVEGAGCSDGEGFATLIVQVSFGSNKSVFGEGRM